MSVSVAFLHSVSIIKQAHCHSSSQRDVPSSQPHVHEVNNIGTLNRYQCIRYLLRKHSLGFDPLYLGLISHHACHPASCPRRSLLQRERSQLRSAEPSRQKSQDGLTFSCPCLPYQPLWFPQKRSVIGDLDRLGCLDHPILDGDRSVVRKGAGPESEDWAGSNPAPNSSRNLPNLQQHTSTMHVLHCGKCIPRQEL
ncbi:hypothetical protein B0T13DRAFT_284009 [Neurospora crassa]|nr:hypothetical protein B0T13DRAFT_284009 [Neurospora crassa]